jgi:hypothetical protein
MLSWKTSFKINEGNDKIKIELMLKIKQIKRGGWK